MRTHTKYAVLVRAVTPGTRGNAARSERVRSLPLASDIGVAEQENRGCFSRGAAAFNRQ